MVGAKAIKKRIKSLRNTKKITRTMQMVSAAKMRKTVQAATKTRLYAQLANDLLLTLSNTKTKTKPHPYMEVRGTKKILAILITSNRGLCGSFNSTVMNKFTEFLASKSETQTIEVIAIGKKGAEFAKRKGLNLVALYEKVNENPNYEEILSITKSVTESFLEKKYDQVFVIYTNFVSALNQESKIYQLLPVVKESITQIIEEAGSDEELINLDEKKIEKNDIIFEPNEQEVLNYVIPRLVEIQMYQTILESAASEHSSRMIAMKNATESTGELIDNLTLEFNKARQSAITQEIAEIVGGADAQD